MEHTKCESCPKTASAECMKSCPRWIEYCSDRRLESRFLLQMAQALDEYLPELEQVLETMPRQGPPHGRLAVSAGIRAYQARRSWVREALQELS